jgi:type II secretory pathway predicted ATPase ExeA
MQVDDSSLDSKAFGEHADAGLIIAYQSHQDALRFLSTALGQPNGVALLQGPTGSGKTTIINEQLGWSSCDAAVALVDGVHLTPIRLIAEMLSQFGIKTATEHDEQLLQQLNHFVTQQTDSARPPVLIVDNAERATPSALRLLNWLAALDSRGEYALRIVLAGKEQLSALLDHDSMRNLARRHPAVYSLNPMTAQETMIYLRTRMIAAGGERSEQVFPIDVCEKLHELSRGWPGPLNKRAIEVMERIAELRSAKPIPRIIVTHDGETVAVHELTEPKYVIGRTELADIVIEDGYVSKMHAMLQVYPNAIVLVDLNSTNGTTVNSTEVPKALLRNNDIISLGRHRLKIENAPALSAEADERIKASDTMTMQSLADLRRARAMHTIAALRHK